MNTETFSIPIRGDITLRFIKSEEAEALYKLVDDNRAYLREWLNWVDAQTGPEASKENILKRIEEAKTDKALDLGIYLGNKIIGSMGFNKIASESRQAEIGYWISGEFQGKGIITDCVRALIAYGFKELKLNRIEIRCSPRNTRSSAIPESLGFTFEGTAREASLLNGRFEDSRTYSLLASEWT